MSSMGSLGTNPRAAHPCGSGDVGFTALTFPFRDFVQGKKRWHHVL